MKIPRRDFYRRLDEIHLGSLKPFFDKRGTPHKRTDALIKKEEQLGDSEKRELNLMREWWRKLEQDRARPVGDLFYDSGEEEAVREYNHKMKRNAAKSLP